MSLGENGRFILEMVSLLQKETKKWGWIPGEYSVSREVFLFSFVVGEVTASLCSNRNDLE